MNPNEKLPGAPHLDRCLESWKVKSALPETFPQQVWKRIRELESRKTPVSAQLYQLIHTLLLNLAQPRRAIACILLFLTLGICTGTLSAKKETKRVKQDLGERYVSMIAPDRDNH